MEDFDQIRKKAEQHDPECVPLLLNPYNIYLIPLPLPKINKQINRTKRQEEIEALESSLRTLSKRARSSSPGGSGKKAKGPSILEQVLEGYERGRRGGAGGKKGKAKEEEEDILAVLGGFRSRIQGAKDDGEQDGGDEDGEGEEREVDNDLGLVFFFWERIWSIY